MVLDFDGNGPGTFDEDYEYENRTQNFLTWQQSLMSTACGLLIMVTVVGNTLIIIAVITTKRLRTVTNCFIMSLAVADWLVGIFVMPFAVAYNLTGAWEWGQLLCAIWVSCDVCLCTASILSLCAISIDRYFAITKPLTYSRKLRSKRLALLMILIVWMVAIAITLCPPILGLYDKDKHKSRSCGYNQNQTYVILSAMMSFFVPFAVMVYVYIKISRVIAMRHDTLHGVNQPIRKKRFKRRSKEDDSDRSERVSSEGEENGVKLSNFSRRQSRMNSSIRVCNSNPDSNSVKVSSFKREHKTAQTLSIVVGGFIACWLPFFCVYLVTPFMPSGFIPPALMLSLTWLGWLNSAINPFIYAFYNPDFRLALWRITLRKCATKKQEARMIRNRTVRQSVHIREFCLHERPPSMLKKSSTVFKMPSSG